MLVFFQFDFKELSTFLIISDKNENFSTEFKVMMARMM